MGTAEKARRAAPILLEAVRMHPGQKRGFYDEKIRDLIQIIRGDDPWPSNGELLDKSFQILRRDGKITFRQNTWHPSDVPTCPHCKQTWLGATPDAGATP